MPYYQCTASVLHCVVARTKGCQGVHDEGCGTMTAKASSSVPSACRLVGRLHIVGSSKYWEEKLLLEGVLTDCYCK